MRAVVLRSHGGPEVLTIEDVPDPVAGPDEIVVAVEHTALNRADVLQRMGLYPDPRQRGARDPGDGVRRHRRRRRRRRDRLVGRRPGDGDRGAAGATPSGSSPMPARRMPIPASVEHRRCGGDPRGVPHGVGRAGGPGRAHVGALGARPCRRVGCRYGGDPDRQGDRGPSGRHLLGGQGRRRAANSVPISCSNAARPTGSPNCRLAVPGRGRRGARRDRWRRGRPQPSCRATRRHDRPGRADGRRQHGGQRRAHPPEADHLDRHHAAVAPAGAQGRRSSQRFIDEILPLFDVGALRPIVDSRFPLDDIAEAHRRMESNANVGKILIDI